MKVQFLDTLYKVKQWWNVDEDKQSTSSNRSCVRTTILEQIMIHVQPNSCELVPLFQNSVTCTCRYELQNKSLEWSKCLCSENFYKCIEKV